MRGDLLRPMRVWAYPRRMAEPLTVLREQLAAQRRDGLTFDVAWNTAHAAALAAARQPERSAWADVLYATQPAWERAWERRPLTRREAALVAVASDGERDQPVEQRRH